MIPRDEFYRRLEICRLCEFWRGACLKGHNLASPTGCPVQKFEPIQGSGYAPDRQVPDPEPGVRARGCCGPPQDVPNLSWAEVIASFGASMVHWIKEGLPLADPDLHARRYGVCKECPQYAKFHCKVCKCLVYAKTKLASEVCPESKW
jgi:hypothetical protein